MHKDDNVSVDDDASDDANVIDNSYVMAQLITNAIKIDLLGKDEAMPLSTSLYWKTCPLREMLFNRQLTIVKLPSLKERLRKS